LNDQLKVSPEELEKFKKETKIDVILTSAKSGQNIDQAFNSMIERCMKKGNLREEKEEVITLKKNVDNKVNTGKCEC